MEFAFLFRSTSRLENLISGDDVRARRADFIWRPHRLERLSPHPPQHRPATAAAGSHHDFHRRFHSGERAVFRSVPAVAAAAARHRRRPAAGRAAGMETNSSNAG